MRVAVAILVVLLWLAAPALAQPTPPGGQPVYSYCSNGSAWVGCPNAGGSGGSATAANQIAVIGTKAAGTAAASALLTGGVYNATPPTLADGQQAALQLNSAGALVVTQPPASTISVTLPAPPGDTVAGPTGFTGTGTLAIATNGAGSVGVQATGSGAGLVFTFEGTVNGSNWFTIPAFIPNGSSLAVTTGGTANGNWIIPASGFAQIRVNLSAISSGTETFTMHASAASAQLPFSANGIQVAAGVFPLPLNYASGTANTTGTSTTALITAVASNRLYVTGFSCANTGTTAALISFQDGSGGTTLWTTIVPAGGGSNLAGANALFRTTLGNGLFFAAGSASTTVYCSATATFLSF